MKPNATPTNPCSQRRRSARTSTGHAGAETPATAPDPTPSSRQHHRHTPPTAPQTQPQQAEGSPHFEPGSPHRATERALVRRAKAHLAAGAPVWHLPGKISHMAEPGAQPFDPQHELVAQLAAELVLSGQLQFHQPLQFRQQALTSLDYYTALLDALLTPPPAGDSELAPGCITLVRVSTRTFTVTSPKRPAGYHPVTVKRQQPIFAATNLNAWWPATARTGRGKHAEGCHQPHLHRIICFLQGTFRPKSKATPGCKRIEGVLTGQEARDAAARYKKLDAAHACQNKSCIRAAHLNLTTRATNMRDESSGGCARGWERTRRRQGGGEAGDGGAGAEAPPAPKSWAATRARQPARMLLLAKAVTKV